MKLKHKHGSRTSKCLFVSVIPGFVREYVPSAELNSNIGAELSYLLSDAESQGFVPLFKVQHKPYII